MKSSRVFLRLVGAALAAMAAACAGHGSATGPTDVAAAAPARATVQGSVASAPSAATGSLGASGAASATVVSVVGTNLSTVTDSSGHFVLGDVPAGETIIGFKGPGFDGQVGIGNLNAGQVVTLNVRVSGSAVVVVSGPAGREPEPSPSATPRPSPEPEPEPEPEPGDDNGGDHHGGNNGGNNGTDDHGGNDGNDDHGGNGGNSGNGGGHDDHGAEVSVTGNIQSTSPLTVAGRRIVTDGSTRVLDRRGQAISVADLKVGQRVEVEGVGQGDNSILASKIKLED